MASVHGSTATWGGLQITAECTVALLLPPFLLMTALAVWLRRKPSAWPLVALAVASGLLLMVNQLRLLAVVWFIQALGMKSGYYWGHTMVGSLITISGLAATLLVYAPLIITRGGASGRR
jgi:exosortase/archaeosortase family protein